MQIYRLFCLWKMQAQLPQVFASSSILSFANLFFIKGVIWYPVIYLDNIKEIAMLFFIFHHSQDWIGLDWIDRLF